MLKYDSNKDETFREDVKEAVKEIVKRFNIPSVDEYSLNIYVTGIFIEAGKKGFEQAKKEIQNLIK